MTESERVCSMGTRGCGYIGLASHECNVDRQVTINDGNPMRLRDPFTRIAVFDGAIKLWSDGGAVLMVPRNSKAYLSGIIGVSDR